MFHDRLNPQMILRQFAWRGIGSIAFDPEFMWAPAFNNYDLKKSVTILAVVDGQEETMRIDFNPQYVPVSISAGGGGQRKPAHIRTDQKPEPAGSLDITYNGIAKNQKAHLVMGGEGLGIHIDSASIKSRQATFLGARTPISPFEDAQRFGQLDILGKQNKIVEFLKIIEPDLKSLSSVAMGENSLIHGDIGLARKIPVAYMGDGISRLLSIILAIATSSNGIVFIDEFENGIHYSAMPKIWEALAKAAREYNCQIVATTHSYECLESAYSAMSGELSDDFSYVRIDKNHNKTTAKCFDYDLLKVAFETNMEVR